MYLLEHNASNEHLNPNMLWIILPEFCHFPNLKPLEIHARLVAGSYATNLVRMAYVVDISSQSVMSAVEEKGVKSLG